MNFIEKNGLKLKLQNTQVPEADEALLREKKPQAKPLQSKFFDNDRKKKEILWDLLDVATEKEIVENRKEFYKLYRLAQLSEDLQKDMEEERRAKIIEEYENYFGSDLYEDLEKHGFFSDKDKGEDDKDNEKDPEPDELTYEYLDENFSKKEMIDKYGQGLNLSKKDKKETIIDAILESKKKESENDQGIEPVNNQENQEDNPGQDQ